MNLHFQLQLLVEFTIFIWAHTFTQFGDRTYRFNVADASMASKDFHVSATVNGEWGPDGDASTTLMMAQNILLVRQQTVQLERWSICPV